MRLSRPAILASMLSTWRQQDLPELVARLAARPGHESVRTHLAEILRHGFGVAYHEVDHEVRLPEVHGRADTLFGSVVFEFKRDLRQELRDVFARLPDYLAERERQTGRRFLGIATDGATFLAFELREGALVEIGKHEPNPARAEALLAWLEPALSNRDDLPPDPLTVERELGRTSLSFGRRPRCAGAPVGRAANAFRGGAEAPALGWAAARSLRHAGRR